MCFFIFLVAGDADIPNAVTDEVLSLRVSRISVTRSIMTSIPVTLERFFFLELVVVNVDTPLAPDDETGTARLSYWQLAAAEVCLLWLFVKPLP